MSADDALIIFGWMRPADHMAVGEQDGGEGGGSGGEGGGIGGGDCGGEGGGLGMQEVVYRSNIIEGQ